MNNLNEDDGDLSARVHTFVRSLVDNGTKNEFIVGPSRCSDGNGALATLHGFTGTTIIKSHIQMILANIWDHPKPGDIDQESS